MLAETVCWIKIFSQTKQTLDLKHSIERVGQTPKVNKMQK